MKLTELAHDDESYDTVYSVISDDHEDLWSEDYTTLVLRSLCTWCWWAQTHHALAFEEVLFRVHLLTSLLRTYHMEN